MSARDSLAKANATSDLDVLRLQKFILELFRNGFIKLHSHRFEFASDLGEKPEVNKIARWQAEGGSDSVVSMAGINIGVESDAVRKMILLLDGSRTARDVEDELVRTLDVPFSERHAFHLGLPQMIKENLRKMAEWGLLVR